MAPLIGHGKAHGHDDHDRGGHSHDLRDASRRGLVIALALIATYMVAEVAGGLYSGSLALLADAGHMLTDAAAIVMALVAMWIADRPASVERTFGYHRTEILATLANTFSLWVIAVLPRETHWHMPESRLFPHHIGLRRACRMSICLPGPAALEVLQHFPGLFGDFRQGNFCLVSGVEISDSHLVFIQQLPKGQNGDSAALAVRI